MSEIDYDNDGIIGDLYDRYSKATPDFQELKKKDTHLVFFYGRLRLTEKTVDFFKDCPYLGEAHSMDMTVRNSPDNVPLVFPLNTIVGEKYRIVGDVFAMTPVQMLSLDKILGNLDTHKRRQSYMTLHDQVELKSGFRPIVQCWIYMGNPEKYRGVYLTTPKHSGFTNKGIKIYDYLGKESKEVHREEKSLFDFNDNTTLN